MRKLFAILLLTSLALPSVHGQANLAPPPRPLPPRTVTPAAEKPEKAAAEKPGHSRSLVQRMFGPRPTPMPAPTPAPEVKRRLKPKAKPATPEAPTEDAVKVAPKASATGAVPATTVKPKTGKGSAKKGTPTGTDAALDDATKFKNAKAKAMEDVHIKDLKGKADGEVNEADAHKALLSYNRALFQKIRELDPSVSDYAGKVEQSMTKRLGAEKSKE